MGAVAAMSRQHSEDDVPHPFGYESCHLSGNGVADQLLRDTFGFPPIPHPAPRKGLDPGPLPGGERADACCGSGVQACAR